MTKFIGRELIYQMIFFNIEKEMKAFEQEESYLSSIFTDYDIAMEEDTAVDDTAQKQNFGNILLQKVKKLIDEISAMIDRLVSRIKNVIRRIMQTDEGFKKQIRTAIKKNKPSEGIKLITYSYNDTVLDDLYNKITKTVFSMVGSLKTSYVEEKEDNNEHPLDMPKEKLYQHVFEKSGCPSDVTSIKLLYDHMRKIYRREKKETLFTADNTRMYYNITMSYSKLETEINAKNTLMRQQVSVLRTNLNNIIKNDRAADDVKKRATKQATNASLLYNLYSNILTMYFELKTECIMSYRLVLKRLYRI